MSRTYSLAAFRSTGANRQVVEGLDLTVPDPGTGHAQAVFGVLSETVTVAQFTDGGATIGTYQMQGSLPAGAVVLGTQVLVPAGFAGDTSAVLTIGDGSDADRYHTGTMDIFATAATGVESGVPSGNLLVTTANQPTLTVTTAADFTDAVTDASGIVTVSIYYLPSA